jgi:hypothetical protein
LPSSETKVILKRREQKIDGLGEFSKKDLKNRKPFYEAGYFISNLPAIFSPLNEQKRNQIP